MAATRGFPKAADARERAVAEFTALGERIQARDGRLRQQGLPEDGGEALFRIIQGEIIPRLMVAHGPVTPRPDGHDGEPAFVTEDDRAHLLAAVTRDSPAECRRIVREVAARAVPREAIFLDLLAFVARRLGELWESDELDFTGVTIGLCRLHEFLRDLSLLPDGAELHVPADAPQILLTTLLGDQHVFGVLMVSEFFRKAGWRVTAEPGASGSELAACLQAEHFDVLGMSAACSPDPGEIRAEIAVLRAASCNPHLRVLVGGRLFAEDRELAEQVGADAAANDARSAPDVGKSLIARSAVRC